MYIHVIYCADCFCQLIDVCEYSDVKKKKKNKYNIGHIVLLDVIFLQKSISKTLFNVSISK